MRRSSISMPGRRARAGGDDDRLALDGLALAVGGLHLDLARRDDAAGAVEGVDLVLFEQEGDAFDVAVDALVLEFHHGGKIELRLADLDAHLIEQMAGLFVELGGVQQRLRGNAADIEASTAEGFVLFDHRDLHAELRRADGADIAAGAGADHDEVVGHELLRTIRRRGRRSWQSYRSTTSRAGSSKISFTRTRNVTASRPSTRRWS